MAFAGGIKKTKCSKCASEIIGKEFLKCCTCNCILHLDCTTNVTFKRFIIMSNSNKQSWKCARCHSACNNVNKTPKQEHSKDEIDNITYRKKPLEKNKTPSSSGSNRTVSGNYRINVHTRNSFDCLSDSEDQAGSPLSSSSKLNIKVNSNCFEPENNQQDNFELMNDKINLLQEKLRNAEQEIEKLRLENSSLKGFVDENTSGLNNLKNICETKIKNKAYRKKRRTVHDSNLSSDTETNEIEQILNYPSMPSKTETKLPTQEEQYEKNMIGGRNSSGGTTSPSPAVVTGCQENMAQVDRKSRICMLSTDKKNKMLTITDSLTKDYELCHYLTPDVGVRRLLNNIYSKISDYTMKDYCIIFIGEEDFRKSQNYASLVSFIKNAVQSITHTNVILCVPIFNCSNYANIYNKRVEVFNDILSSDETIYEYVYLLDSNLHLTYDTKMFNKYSGHVNKLGMKVILQELNTLIGLVEEENVFFRQ